MRKIALLSIFVLVFLLGSRVILAEEEVPSDLALDLAQAERNPAPQRQQIITDETPKAEVTTNIGRITVQPETQLAPEVEKQPANVTDHPEQTTSAQVQETTVPADTSTDQSSTDSGVNVEQPDLNNSNSTNSNSSTNSGADSLVPGTTVKEPDDNAAPSTPSAPTSAPDNSSQPQNETPPVITAPSDTQPDNGNSTNSNDAGGDSAVQGVSTARLDLFGRMVNFFRGLMR